MSTRTASVIAWSLWAVFVAMVAWMLWELTHGRGSWDEAFIVLAIGYATVAALIVSRRPDNAVGWLLLTVSLTLAFGGLAEVYVFAPRPGRQWVGWVSTWSWHVWLTLTAVFLPLVFPTGRLASRRWRPVLWLGAVSLLLGVTSTALRPGELDIETRGVANPFGVGGPAADVLVVAEYGSSVLLTGCFILAAASLVVRFRQADGAVRLQLKWFVFAGLLTVFGLALAMVEVLNGEGTVWARYVGAVGWYTFLIACIVAVPLATGIAILRHRLYDIDLVINRTLVYGSLTAALVATYWVSVLFFQFVLRSLTTSESDLAVAGSTLAVAALFRPARARIQAFVDHRFYRQRYDAARTLEGFGGRLREQLDVSALADDLGAVVRETMQPAHVSVWLRPTGGKR